MTDEVIKNKAEEYGYAEAQKLLKMNENCHTHFSFNKADISKAFQDGAKWGMEHEWHDLIKDPKDLPKEDGTYLVSISLSNQIVTDTHEYRDGYFSKYLRIIAWCELPKYKE